MVEAPVVNPPQDPPTDPPKNDPPQDPPKNDVQVPKYRFDEVSKRAREAEQALQKVQAEQQQREEEAASKQGEWQKVAEKRQGKIDTLQQKVTDLENQIVRDKRFRAWTQGASGVIRSDALGDAFEHIGDEDWQTVNEDDENSVKVLAQGLAERKPYLAGGPIGAGSGGSSRPVMGLSSNKDVDDRRSTTLSSGRETFSSFKKNRSHWK